MHLPYIGTLLTCTDQLTCNRYNSFLIPVPEIVNLDLPCDLKY